MPRRIWAVLTATMLLALTSLAGVMAANEPASVSYDITNNFNCYEIDPSANNNVLYRVRSGHYYIAPTLDSDGNASACLYLTSLSSSVQAMDTPDIATGSSGVTRVRDTNIITVNTNSTSATTAPGRPIARRNEDGTLTLTFGDLPEDVDASDARGYYWLIYPTASTSLNIYSSQSTVTIPSYTYLSAPDSWPYFPRASFVYFDGAWRRSSLTPQVTGGVPYHSANDLYIQSGDIIAVADVPTIEEPVLLQNDPDSSNQVLASVSWEATDQADGYVLEGVPSGTGLDAGCRFVDALVECSGTRARLTLTGAGRAVLRLRGLIENTSATAARTMTLNGQDLYIMPETKAFSPWSSYVQMTYEPRIPSSTFVGTVEREDWGKDSLGGVEATKEIVTMFGLEVTEMLILVGWIALSLLAALAVGMSTQAMGAGSIAMGGMVGTATWVCGPLMIGIPWVYTVFPLALCLAAAMLVAKQRLQ